MKKLYFVRHGISHYNATGIWAGRADTPLTPLGVEQAKKVAKEIKKKNLSIDIIMTTPLSRAQKTADIIAKEIGYPLDKIAVHELFTERTFGVLEHTPIEGTALSHKDYHKLDEIEGVEKLEDMQKRAVEALAYLHSLDADNILLVGHGTFARALRRAIDNEPHTAEYDRPIKRFKNAELVELI